MQVFKFGGASVKDAEAVRNVGNIITRYTDEPLLVVVSAMGKMTNAFEKLIESYYKQKPDLMENYQAIKDFHQNIINDLLVDQRSETYDDIDNLFLELECILETPAESSYDYTYDQIVCFGELISTRIISTWLNGHGLKNRWMDCRNFICTDTNHLEAHVDWPATEDIIQKKLLPIVKKQLVITQGFIGRSADLSTTTLGRDGSDYSAAIFAYGLGANSVTIWKDVPGVMNADPKKYEGAELVNHLSFKEAIELAYYGANVIHPKTIQPLRKKGLPLYVKSFYEPELKGTEINNIEQSNPQSFYIHKDKQALLSFSTKDFSFITEEHLSQIFTEFKQHNIRVNLMQNSAISFSVCVNASGHLEEVLDKLKTSFEIDVKNNVELLSVKNTTFEKNNLMLKNKTVLLEQKNQDMIQYAVMN
ncbi:MAG: aspartate kinase [Bacteroidota bacterium]|nr:aspartate kinase [Bacteroidota bacterium]